MTPHERRLQEREEAIDKVLGTEPLRPEVLTKPAPVGYYEHPVPLGSRSCPLPGWWARWRNHVQVGTVWICECGERWVWTGPPGQDGRCRGWMEESNMTLPAKPPRPM